MTGPGRAAEGEAGPTVEGGRRRRDPGSVDRPEMTVVVPTRDRPAPLAQCLAAISRQETDRAFEIVVVDDRSRESDRVAAVADDAGARLVRGGGAGPAAARNLGASEATARVVCFTDDDCRPGPRWLPALARRFEEGEAVVTGPTRNSRPHDPYAMASQTVTNHLAAGTARRDGYLRFAPTSNLACTTELVDAVPFDESYPLAGGEDRDWCARVGERGVAIAYELAAWVDHDQELSLTRFWRQHVRYGRGAARLRGEPGRGGLQPPSFYTGLLRAGFGQGLQAGALVGLAQVATAVGILAERRSTRSNHP